MKRIKKDRVNLQKFLIFDVIIDACEKINFKPPFFLIFWVVWKWLAIHDKIDSFNLWENLMFMCMQKIKFAPSFFLGTLQKYCKLVILGTLGMPDYGQQNDGISLQKNGYLHIKNQIHPLPLFRNIAIFQTLMFIYMLKINLIPHFVLEILYFIRNPAI